MKIGLDFDNTIVCYDQSIALLADEYFDLPNEIPRTKLGLRNYLRSQHREPEWTAFQGQLYGPGMFYAKPFEGAINTMQQLIAEGCELTIVSHRSRFPYAGPKYDLHDAAHNWIIRELHPNKIFDESSQRIYFLETFSEKLAQISDSNFDVFLDDLSTVLESADFPESTLGILFNPAATHYQHERINQIQSWTSLFESIRERF